MIIYSSQLLNAKLRSFVTTDLNKFAIKIHAVAHGQDLKENVGFLRNGYWKILSE